MPKSDPRLSEYKNILVLTPWSKSKLIPCTVQNWSVQGPSVHVDADSEWDHWTWIGLDEATWEDQDPFLVLDVSQDIVLKSPEGDLIWAEADFAYDPIDADDLIWVYLHNGRTEYYKALPSGYTWIRFT